MQRAISRMLLRYTELYFAANGDSLSMGAEPMENMIGQVRVVYTTTN